MARIFCPSLALTNASTLKKSMLDKWSGCTTGCAKRWPFWGAMVAHKNVWLGSLQHYFCKLSYDMDWVYTIKNQTWTIAMGIEAIQIRTFVFRHLPSPSPFLLSMQIPRRPLDSPKHVVSYYLSFDHKCVRIPPDLPKRSFISYSMI